jgi:anaerobic selenocysteine-containing dehydrogenase
MTPKKDEITLTLKVQEALSKDVGRATARIDPEDIKALGLAVGDIIEIGGKRKAPAKIMPCYAEVRQAQCRQDGEHVEPRGHIRLATKLRARSR